MIVDLHKATRVVLAPHLLSTLGFSVLRKIIAHIPSVGTDLFFQRGL